MTTKELIGTIIASVITSVLTGSLVAYLSLKDALAAQNTQIVVLQTQIATLQSVDNNLLTDTEKWDRAALIVERHDQFLRDLVEQLNTVTRTLKAIPRAAPTPAASTGGTLGSLGGFGDGTQPRISIDNLPDFAPVQSVRPESVLILPNKVEQPAKDFMVLPPPPSPKALEK